ncbi:hypothetical protein RFI_37929, partial [Reticulomyxa filosa]
QKAIFTHRIVFVYPSKTYNDLHVLEHLISLLLFLKKGETDITNASNDENKKKVQKTLKWSTCSTTQIAFTFQGKNFERKHKISKQLCLILHQFKIKHFQHKIFYLLVKTFFGVDKSFFKCYFVFMEK